MTITRAEETALRRMGASLAGRSAAAEGIRRDFARVTAVRDDGSLDVDCGSPEYPMPMYGVPVTSACDSVAVGDRVVIDTYAHVPLATAVLRAKPGFKTLFWDPSAPKSGATRLAETAAGFRALIVLYRGFGGEYGSTLVPNPDGASFEMTTTLVIGGYWRICSKRSTVSGGLIDTAVDAKGQFMTGTIQNGSSAAEDSIGIIGVIGVR